MKNEKAYIGRIQHFNVHDGNGFRTTLFFQGCSMKCKWCQNPELQSHSPIQVSNDEEGYEYSSQAYTVEEIIRECKKEAFFYRFHSGGVTLSGGEPLIHGEFVASLLKQLEKEGINTVIETAGYVPWKNIELVAPYVDTFLWDVKLISNELRKEWLGVTDSLDLDNLKRISKTHSKIVIRIPLIPDVNTGDEFEKIVHFLDEIAGISYVHILPFHQFGSSKYKSINKKYEMSGVSLLKKDVIEHCRQQLGEHGYKVDVGGTGFTYL